MKKFLINSGMIGALVLLLSSTSIHKMEPKAAFNPVFINEKPMNFAEFSLDMKGKLSMAINDPGTSTLRKIPFKVYLRRRGYLINSGASSAEKEISEIEIGHVLKQATMGDLLVIEPTDPTLQWAKRVLYLRINWVSFLKKSDNC